MRSLILVLLIPAFSLAQKNATIPDPDPEIERKTFTVAPGFEVNLFAADPMLAKPIQMNWDAQGRLWIASSEVYPQIKPGQVANDKIIILEDTNNDGVADKTEVFADGLLIPTAVLPGDGGAYVANSTEIIHLSQSKPGIKADKKRVVLSGFGTEDTHHLIHTFRWGPDGAMYFNQSVYIHSHVETPHGTKRLNGGGIWRYEPRTQKLDVFARGFWNPWGLQFDKYGQAFATDGANGEGIVHVIPGASYPTGGNQAPRVLHGMNPGSPKFCGLEIVSGRHFPEDWQGDMITNDFRGHRVCRFKLRDSGSTFESREMTEVIKSNHPAFRPIDVSIGPDGALYIADWYNPIIQHGEVDFRDERRDKTHGRIWRVTAKGRPLVAKPKLNDASTPQLLEELKTPEQWTRMMAKQVLVQDGRDLDAHVGKFLQTVKPADQELVFELFQLVNTKHCLGNTQVWDRAMAFKTANREAQVIRGLRIMNDVEMKYLGDAIDHDSPKVRLATLDILVRRKSATAASLALNALNSPMDSTIDHALWLTLRELQEYWLPAFKEGKFDYGNDMKKLTFALEAVQSPETISQLVTLLMTKKIPKEQFPTAWTLVAKHGNDQDVFMAYSWGSSEGAQAAGLPVLEAVEASTRKRKIQAPQQMHKAWADRHSPFEGVDAVQPVLYRLAGLWKVETMRDKLIQVARESKSAAYANAAIDALASLGGEASLTVLVDLAGAPKHSGNLTALQRLVVLDIKRATVVALKRLKQSPETSAEVVSAFLNQKNGAATLAKTLEGTTVPSDAAKLGLKAVRSAGNPSPALTEALTKAGGLGAAKKEPTSEEIKALAAEALKLGDAARGELVYRRKELQCLACHAINGAGGQVGPDLTSLGASAQTDYIVDSLLLPNKAIKEGYHTVDVTTTAGRIHSGVKVREGAGELVLRDKDDREISLKLDDIETRRVGRTLMPDGTVEPLTKGELLDLVRFLGDLGKAGPYEPSKARVVRTWQTAEATPENLSLFRRERTAAAAEKPAAVAWASAYSRVNGELPLADLPTVTTFAGVAPQSVVRFKLMVNAAGEVKLKTNPGVSAYVGSEPVNLEKPILLAAGEKIVTLIVNRDKETTPLRVELEDVKDSPARVSLMGGK